MKIESVDFFYLSMPEVLDIGDGSQDALLVRVAAGAHVGWGECEAAPLPSIASLICPISHSACKPVLSSVLGARIDSPRHIGAIGDAVRANSLDLLQADHTLSGIEIALWDLLGRKLEEPTWRLLGYRRAYVKTPYASVLFGESAEQTLAKAKAIHAAGYRAAKFGWGPYGRASVTQDAAQVAAAREGLGPDGILLVDAGTVWNADVEAARRRLPALRQAGALWLEEPFVSGALEEYRALATESGSVGIAGGEGCHNFYMAKSMIEHAGLRYVQIDAGRIGGLAPAKRVADHAQARNVIYVNHTFTSSLALSASLQPYAGLEHHAICEFPTELQPLARSIAKTPLARDAHGQVRVPDAPGLGIDVDVEAIRPYVVDTEIRVKGHVLYRTPPLA